MNATANPPTLEAGPSNWTKAEYAAFFRISLRTADRHISDGTVKALKIGARVLIPKSEVARLLAV